MRVSFRSSLFIPVWFGRFHPTKTDVGPGLALTVPTGISLRPLKMRWLGLALLSFAILVLGDSAFAVPNLNVGTGTPLELLSTIVPDTDNSHLYYFFPRRFTLLEEKGRKSFTYFEKSGVFSTSAYATMIFSPQLGEETLQKIADVRKVDTAAVFSPIPVTASTIYAGGELAPFLKQISCQPTGGTLESDIGCTWKLDSGRRKAFQKLVRAGQQIQLMFVAYEFSALAGDKIERLKHAVAMYIDGLETGPYFFDSNGKPIVK